MLQAYLDSIDQSNFDSFSSSPLRPVLTIHNYCGSYGMLKHMDPDHLDYRRDGLLDSWPLYSISNAGEMEGGIPGLFQIFLSELASLDDPSMSFDEFFGHVKGIYRSKNPSFRETENVAQRPSQPCIKCRAFDAPNPATLGLCSVCYKNHMAMPEDQRDDLDLLRLETAKAIEIEAAKAPPKAVEVCALRAVVGQADAGSLPMGVLLPHAARGVAAAAHVSAL